MRQRRFVNARPLEGARLPHLRPPPSPRRQPFLADLGARSRVVMRGALGHGTHLQEYPRETATPRTARDAHARTYSPACTGNRYVTGGGASGKAPPLSRGGVSLRSLSPRDLFYIRPSTIGSRPSLLDSTRSRAKIRPTFCSAKFYRFHLGPNRFDQTSGVYLYAKSSSAAFHFLVRTGGTWSQIEVVKESPAVPVPAVCATPRSWPHVAQFVWCFLLYLLLSAVYADPRRLCFPSASLRLLAQ